jgi:hypothetical protein
MQGLLSASIHSRQCVVDDRFDQECFASTGLARDGIGSNQKNSGKQRIIVKLARPKKHISGSARSIDLSGYFDHKQ